MASNTGSPLLSGGAAEKRLNFTRIYSIQSSSSLLSSLNPYETPSNFNINLSFPPPTLPPPLVLELFGVTAEEFIKAVHDEQILLTSLHPETAQDITSGGSGNNGVKLSGVTPTVASQSLDVTAPHPFLPPSSQQQLTTATTTTTSSFATSLTLTNASYSTSTSTSTTTTTASTSNSISSSSSVPLSVVTAEENSSAFASSSSSSSAYTSSNNHHLNNNKLHTSPTSSSSLFSSVLVGKRLKIHDESFRRLIREVCRLPAYLGFVLFQRMVESSLCVEALAALREDVTEIPAIDEFTLMASTATSGNLTSTTMTSGMNSLSSSSSVTPISVSNTLSLPPFPNSTSLQSSTIYYQAEALRQSLRLRILSEGSISILDWVRVWPSDLSPHHHHHQQQHHQQSSSMSSMSSSSSSSSSSTSSRLARLHPLFIPSPHPAIIVTMLDAIAAKCSAANTIAVHSNTCDMTGMTEGQQCPSTTTSSSSTSIASTAPTAGTASSSSAFSPGQTLYNFGFRDYHVKSYLDTSFAANNDTATSIGSASSCSIEKQPGASILYNAKKKKKTWYIAHTEVLPLVESLVERHPDLAMWRNKAQGLFERYTTAVVARLFTTLPHTLSCTRVPVSVFIQVHGLSFYNAATSNIIDVPPYSPTLSLIKLIEGFHQLSTSPSEMCKTLKKLMKTRLQQEEDMQKRQAQRIAAGMTSPGRGSFRSSRNIGYSGGGVGSTPINSTTSNTSLCFPAPPVHLISTALSKYSSLERLRAIDGIPSPPPIPSRLRVRLGEVLSMNSNRSSSSSGRSVNSKSSPNSFQLVENGNNKDTGTSSSSSGVDGEVLGGRLRFGEPSLPSGGKLSPAPTLSSSSLSGASSPSKFPERSIPLSSNSSSTSLWNSSKGVASSIGGHIASAAVTLVLSPSVLVREGLKLIGLHESNTTTGSTAIGSPLVLTCQQQYKHSQSPSSLKRQTITPSSLSSSIQIGVNGNCSDDASSNSPISLPRYIDDEEDRDGDGEPTISRGSLAKDHSKKQPLQPRFSIRGSTNRGRGAAVVRPSPSSSPSSSPSASSSPASLPRSNSRSRNTDESNNIYHTTVDVRDSGQATDSASKQRKSNSWFAMDVILPSSPGTATASSGGDTDDSKTFLGKEIEARTSGSNNKKSQNGATQGSDLHNKSAIASVTALGKPPSYTSLITTILVDDSQLVTSSISSAAAATSAEATTPMRDIPSSKAAALAAATFLQSNIPRRQQSLAVRALLAVALPVTGIFDSSSSSDNAAEIVEAGGGGGGKKCGGSIDYSNLLRRNPSSPSLLTNTATNSTAIHTPPALTSFAVLSNQLDNALTAITSDNPRNMNNPEVFPPLYHTVSFASYLECLRAGLSPYAPNASYNIFGSSNKNHHHSNHHQHQHRHHHSHHKPKNTHLHIHHHQQGGSFAEHLMADVAANEVVDPFLPPISTFMLERMFGYSEASASSLATGTGVSSSSSFSTASTNLFRKSSSFAGSSAISSPPSSSSAAASPFSYSFSSSSKNGGFSGNHGGLLSGIPGHLSFQDVALLWAACEDCMRSASSIHYFCQFLDVDGDGSISLRDCMTVYEGKIWQLRMSGWLPSTPESATPSSISTKVPSSSKSKSQASGGGSEAGGGGKYYLQTMDVINQILHLLPLQLVEAAKEEARGDFNLLLDCLTFTSKDIRDAKGGIGPLLYSFLIAIPPELQP